MDVSKWKLADVVAWLQRVELGQYVESFTTNAVDGPALLKLEKDSLKETLKVEEKDVESFTGCIRDLRQQTDLAKQMEEYMCHICMELLFDPVTAKCGHTFCKHCLQTWLAKSTTCPVDREQLPKEVPSTAVHLRDLLASRFVDHYIDRSQSREAKVQQAAEEHQRKLEEAEKQTRIKALKRHFNAGFQLDDSVLEAVLEMCENNVEQAKTYLELTGQEPAHFIPVEELAAEGVRVPRDYAADPIAYPPLKIEEKPSLVAALVNAFIGSDSTYTLHMQLQRDHYALYVRVLKLLLARGVDMNHGAKSRVLAVCWMRRDWDLSEFLFGTEANGLLSEIPARADTFGVPEVLKALKLLDSNRQIRAKEKRLARLQALPNVKNKRIGVVVSDLNDLKREPIPVGSLSGALIRHVKKVILRIPRQKLEFFALQLPTEPWKELADLLHLHSEKSLCISWFMKRVFGAEPPADSIVAACANLGHSNSLELLKKHQPPYSFVRCKIPDLSEEEKDVISKYIPVDTCIWWHEDLQSPSVNALLAQRLRGEEVVSLNYGKLMERLLYFKQQGQDAEGIFKELLPLAEQKLRQLSLQLQSPVVVLGDASFSMDVAIRVSVIMSSIVAALSNAELRFFNTVSVKPPVVPQTAADVLEIAQSTRADGQTAPAAALWEYYEQKKRVNVFVVVSDERENLKSNGMYFPQLFYKYCKEVHPAKLVLISFLEANAKGQMATALEKMGIKPIQYSLDSRRPDLTKLDGLIAQLSTHTEAFVEAIQKADQ